MLRDVEQNVDVDKAAETDRLLILEEKDEDQEEKDEDLQVQEEDEIKAVDAWFSDGEEDDHDEASPLLSRPSRVMVLSHSHREKNENRGPLPVGGWYWRALVTHGITPHDIRNFAPVQTIYRLKLQAAMFICLLFSAATFTGVYEWNPLIQLLYFTCAACPNYMFGLFVYRYADTLLIREHCSRLEDDDDDVRVRPSPFLERLVDPGKSRHVIFTLVRTAITVSMVTSFAASTVYLYSRYA